MKLCGLCEKTWCSLRFKFFLQTFTLLIVSISINSCTSTEYNLIGITSKSEEMYYYGKNFTVTAIEIEEEKLNEVKIDLKNSIATIKTDRPEELWKEISELSLTDGKYILFQIYPETKIMDKFLEFKFQLDGKPPIKYYSMYQQILKSTMRNSNYYTNSFYNGTYYGNYGIHAYPMSSIPYETTTVHKVSHVYSFLVLFEKDSNVKSKEILTITTPHNHLIEFRREN